MGVEITKVIPREPDEDARALGFWFTASADPSQHAYSITFDGWAVGAEAPVKAIQVGMQNMGLWRLPVTWPRPDVAERFPEIPWAAASGFYHRMNALKLPREFRLELGAVLPDEAIVWMGTIWGTREELPKPAPSRFRPIVVTTLGRTGSTWLIALLAKHPQVLAFAPFEYEPTLVSYWTDVFGALAEPASYRQFMSADVYGPEWFLGTQRPSPNPGPSDPRLERWLDHDYVEQLADISKGRVDAFYEQVAVLDRRPEATHFAEKMLPGSFAQRIFPELYPEGTEVFLVRDFRDMFCSILAYDRRRGFAGFGRSGGVSDEEYVQDVKRDVAMLHEAWKASPAAHVVRYEDLILKPRQSVQMLLSRLGVDSSPGTIDQMLMDTSNSDVGEAHRTTASPRASIGRWQRDLDDRLQAACDEAFGETLEAFGYSRTSSLVTGIGSSAPE